MKGGIFMPKQLISVLLLSALLFGFASTGLATTAGARTDLHVVLNGNELPAAVRPSLIGGTVFAPLKPVAETLGAQLTWSAPSQTVTITKEGTAASLVLSHNSVTVNGLEYTLPVPPYTAAGRTMVPLELLDLVFGVDSAWNPLTGEVTLDGPVLPVVGSLANLQRLLTDAQETRYGSSKWLMYRAGAAEDSVTTAAPNAQNEQKSADSGGDYSTTNVQVEGVDEADIIKTDGEYIYQINRNRILVVRAKPADAMEVVSILKFDEANFAPQEIYLDDQNLIVIGNAYNQVPIAYEDAVKAEPQAKIAIFPPYRQTGSVKAYIYDITDPGEITETRQVEVEGYYLSSRKIGSSLYLVANKYLDWYYAQEQNPEGIAPAYRDTVAGDKFVDFAYSDIRYFPGAVEPNYLLVAGLNLDQDDEAMQVSAYLGSGQNIYASQENLYVAVTQYRQADEPATDAQLRLWQPPPVTTGIYKFALEDGAVKHRGQGEVPGTILNQFSMDEYAGHFRIATTNYKYTVSESLSTNNLYVLDETMDITGSLEDLAPGERIYSVRFMGERGYVVTFKNVDPLFVIDLADPEKPTVLGALKIPGYSDYLHPYDDTHIIGFGKDTIELPQKDWEGKDTGSMAFYQGMKLAIFDVSDVANPKEMYKTTIGDRGTDSELLRNHKALLFAPEKNLLAFPVTVLEVKKPAVNPTGFPEYGEFTFQGAYVYDISLEDGFELKGRITHLTDTDYLKSGYGWYQGELTVERAIYIGDTLYTLSQGKIKANDLKNLAEIGALSLPQ